METSGGRGRKAGKMESLQRSGSNQRLFDVIGDDPVYGYGKDSKKSWRHLKEKLRLHRGGSCPGSAWTSTMHIPTSDVPINPRQYANTTLNNTSNNRNRMIARFSSDSGESAPLDISAVRDVDMELMSNRGSRAPSLQRNASWAMERNMSLASGRFEHTNSLAMRRSRGLDEHDDDDFDQTLNSAKKYEKDESENEDNDEDEDNGKVGGEEKPGRMSLMDLLAETEGSAYAMDEDDEDEDEDDDREGGGGDYSNCCICMVRHKGAAFIQCGHTFCRLCSRELCFQKGNCPLCDNFILEILDIF